jgi:hypothetical protein
VLTTKLFLTYVCMSLGLGVHLWNSDVTQTPPPTLSGRWQIEFSLGSARHIIQFDSQASGDGTFLVLDQRSSAPPATPTKASWSLRGQSPAIYYFVITGDVEFPTSDGGTEKGKLELSASSDLVHPITSLRGWGQFHSSSKPNDGRGAEDPIFDFTARRLEGLTVRLVSPNANRKLRRGRDVNIEWEIESAFPVTSQELLVSLDGGETFLMIASSLESQARSFTWTVPESLPRTKKALIKIVASDANGAVAEGLSAGDLRIK